MPTAYECWVCPSCTYMHNPPVEHAYLVCAVCSTPKGQLSLNASFKRRRSKRAFPPAVSTSSSSTAATNTSSKSVIDCTIQEDSTCRTSIPKGLSLQQVSKDSELIVDVDAQESPSAAEHSEATIYCANDRQNVINVDNDKTSVLKKAPNLLAYTRDSSAVSTIQIKEETPQRNEKVNYKDRQQPQKQLNNQKLGIMSSKIFNSTNQRSLNRKLSHESLKSHELPSFFKPRSYVNIYPEINTVQNCKRNHKGSQIELNTIVSSSKTEVQNVSVSSIMSKSQKVKQLTKKRNSAQMIRNSSAKAGVSAAMSPEDSNNNYDAESQKNTVLHTGVACNDMIYKDYNDPSSTIRVVRKSTWTTKQIIPRLMGDSTDATFTATNSIPDEEKPRKPLATKNVKKDNQHQQYRFSRESHEHDSSSHESSIISAINERTRNIRSINDILKPRPSSSFAYPYIARMRNLPNGSFHCLSNLEELSNHCPMTVVCNVLPIQVANQLLQQLEGSSSNWNRGNWIIHGKEYCIPRTTATFYLNKDDNRCDNDITEKGEYYDHNQANRSISNEMKEATKHITDAVRRLRPQSNWEPNFLLSNRYKDGSECVGWHSDHITKLGPRPIIVGLSLGACRKFEMRQQKYSLVSNNSQHQQQLVSKNGRGEHIGKTDEELTKSTIAEKMNSSTCTRAGNGNGLKKRSDKIIGGKHVSVYLPHNSIVIMWNDAQESWQHCVPRCSDDSIIRNSQVGSVRISLTFRMKKELPLQVSGTKCHCNKPAGLKAKDGKYYLFCEPYGKEKHKTCNFWKSCSWADEEAKLLAAKEQGFDQERVSSANITIQDR